ncbi:unnamed protein product [Rotaria magnacalcarata]|uniref:Cation/H+ exchanger transmembrane domain-containing protein n=2 Tax=Rotaria magnacalcarata TaxID=392030 RepID=A0A819J9P9_9BILA|nr:unnamed protein product [Rotaria magnacalcarata]CAF4330098.1 unnamed protein product [Rotaria magnacalcarata]
MNPENIADHLPDFNNNNLGPKAKTVTTSYGLCASSSYFQCSRGFELSYFSEIHNDYEATIDEANDFKEKPDQDTTNHVTLKNPSKIESVLTISVAAIEDIAVWVILAVATAFSKGGPPIQVINIHAFFGAFIAGLVIPRHQQKGTIHDFLAVRIELFIIAFFLPLYFTNSGLKTHLYMLSTGRAWYTLIAIVLIASLSKIVPVTLMAKLVTRKKESWSFALTVGILMNTRGIVQLAVLNIGVELGVLSPVIFAIFVVAAVIMTLATSPLVYLVYTRHKPAQKQHIIEVKKSKNPVQKRYYLETHSANDQQLKPFRKLRLELPSPLSNTAIPIHGRNFPKFMNTNR